MQLAELALKCKWHTNLFLRHIVNIYYKLLVYIIVTSNTNHETFKAQSLLDNSCDFWMISGWILILMDDKKLFIGLRVYLTLSNSHNPVHTDCNNVILIFQ